MTFASNLGVTVYGIDSTVDTGPLLNYAQKLVLASSPDAVYAQRISVTTSNSFNIPAPPTGANYLLVKFGTTTDVGTGALALVSVAFLAATVAVRVPAGGFLLLPVATLNPSGGSSISSQSLTQTAVCDVFYF
jgi:hypothetical protein